MVYQVVSLSPCLILGASLFASKRKLPIFLASCLSRVRKQDNLWDRDFLKFNFPSFFVYSKIQMLHPLGHLIWWVLVLGSVGVNNVGVIDPARVCIILLEEKPKRQKHDKKMYTVRFLNNFYW